MNNVTPFHWTEDLLPALGEAGLEFEGVNAIDWRRRLKGKLRDEELDGGKVDDPSMKLIDFWERKYGRAEEIEGRKEKAEVMFDTKKAEEYCRTMRDRMPNLVKEGYIKRFLESWKEVWS